MHKHRDKVMIKPKTKIIVILYKNYVIIIYIVIIPRLLNSLCITYRITICSFNTKNFLCDKIALIL